MTNLDALNEAFAGGTRWAITGDTPTGEEVGGTILSVEVQQVRDFDTNEPEFWPDGNPINEVVIEVQTDLRDGENDKGIRAHHVKTFGSQAKELKRALREAGTSSPADGLKPGNEFYGTRTGKEQVEGKKFKRNIFAFRIVKNAGAGLNAALEQEDDGRPAHEHQAELPDPAPAARKVRGGKPAQKAAPEPEPEPEPEEDEDAGLDEDTAKKVRAMITNDFDHAMIRDTLGVTQEQIDALS